MKDKILKVMVMLTEWYVICGLGVILIILNLTNVLSQIPIATGVILIAMGLIEGIGDRSPFTKKKE